MKDAIDKELELYNLIPRGVVESHRVGSGQLRFNAELSFGGHNYVLVKELADHDEARRIADKKAEELRALLKATGQNFMKAYPVAKG